MTAPKPTGARLHPRDTHPSAAARLLNSTGSAPIARTAPAGPAATAPRHSETAGPEQPAPRANDHEMAPRHFRRADTWR